MSEFGQWLGKKYVQIVYALKGDVLSYKGEAMMAYCQRVLNGDIGESDRIEEYEIAIERVMEENQVDRTEACTLLKNVLEVMPRKK